MAGFAESEISLADIPHLSPADPVNSGSADSLVPLPGIGESTAALILSEREANGIFRYPEDLMSVRGIGPAKLQAILPYLTIDTDESEN